MKTGVGNGEGGGEGVGASGGGRPERLVVHDDWFSALATTAGPLVDHAKVTFGVGGEYLLGFEDGFVQACAPADPEEFPGKVNPENVEAFVHFT